MDLSFETSNTTENIESKQPLILLLFLRLLLLLLLYLLLLLFFPIRQQSAGKHHAEKPYCGVTESRLFKELCRSF